MERRVSDDSARGLKGELRKVRVRTVLALGLGVLLLAGLSLGLVLVLGGSEDNERGNIIEGPPGDAFTIDFPAGWHSLRSEELETLPGRPLGVLRRDDGKGFVVIRKEKRATSDFTKLGRELDGELARRLKDFKKQSARTVKLRAGQAFFYSYVLTGRGTVHSIVIVPAGARSYVLNTVAQGGENAVAREIGRIVVSFDV